jgi:hypothetical protein
VTAPDESTEWLGRVRHDLVKRLLWSARDRRELGGPVRPGELVAALIDEEGSPVEAAVLWTRLCADAPASVPGAALAAFGVAVGRATAAARADDLSGVLALEVAFETLDGKSRRNS